MTQFVKHRPILLTSAMVQATLNDLKTNTRRVMKSQPKPTPARIVHCAEAWGKVPAHAFIPESNSGKVGIFEPYFYTCLYGLPNERLWVRESHWQFGQWFPKTGGKGKRWAIYAKLPICVRYTTEKPISQPGGSETCHWRRVPGIHMPRWASRLTLEIDEVRAERLQDISEADARAEGVSKIHSMTGTTYKNYLWHGGAQVTQKQVDRWPYQFSDYETAKGSFSSLWNSINGDKPGFAWADNPYVWVIVFQTVDRETEE